MTKTGSASADSVLFEEGSINVSGLISFTIDGVEFWAENGMTWAQWYESSYNTSPVYIEIDYLWSDYLTNHVIGTLTDTIVDGEDYPPIGSFPCK